MNTAVTLMCVLALGAPALAGAPPKGPAPGNAAVKHSAQPKPDRFREAGLRKSAERPKLDRFLENRARVNTGTSRVIIELKDGATAAGVTHGLGASLGRQLRAFKGHVAQVPNKWLRTLANNPLVKAVYLDRPIGGEMNRVAVTTGARTVQQFAGFDGAGVGVAIIDSGITSWHDDLAGAGLNGEKVVQFVDFVNAQPMPYDDNGHGTHVAGIIAGNGYDSNGAGAGIAPGAHLVGLKVLDQNGGGHISDVIAALDWVVTNRAAYNIRVVNLSVGAQITESYWTDPLALAAKAAVDAGVVVVAAAGNVGKNAAGQIQYGGITAPGNAPWVLTVGASSHMGTIERWDDTIAGFSSRGPSYIDYGAKPDLVAPGTGIVSLSDPNSTFYTTKANFLLGSSQQASYLPYLSLSGTSMSAPVVSGAVALMLQANPSLTPNAVKAILEYTAQKYAGYNSLTQGAGYLNSYGAVELARFYRTAVSGAQFPTSPFWSRYIIWGNHRIGHGVILPSANAWKASVAWGAERDELGDNIVWGNACPADADCENIVWGNSEDAENITWGNPGDDDNIVWGNSVDTDGDGQTDNIVWGNSVDTDGDGQTDNIVWGNGVEDENIIWGNSVDPETDNIVWGNSSLIDDENVVWGNDCGDGADCENIVWGASTLGPDGDNIVWGNCESLDNIVWGQSGDVDENIVWGQSADEENIVWGQSDGEDNVVWGNSTIAAVIFGALSSVPTTMDPAAFEQLFVPAPPPPPPPPPPPADTTPPVLTVPSNQTAEATSGAGAVVAFAASATDAVDAAPVVSCAPASDALFPLGTTTVTCTATDATGNAASASFTVTVGDTTPPVLTVPSDQTAEATSGEGAVVAFAASATDAVDAAPVVSCAPASDALFPLGTTTVTCTATDATGNAASASFTVTVGDTTPPVLTVPSNETAEATSGAGAVVAFAASATDAVDAAPVVSCVPASDALFPLGTTTVTCTATDATGNATSASFTVTVTDPSPPTVLSTSQSTSSTSETLADGSVVTTTVDVTTTIWSDNTVTTTTTTTTTTTAPDGTVTTATSTTTTTETIGGGF